MVGRSVQIIIPRLRQRKRKEQKVLRRKVREIGEPREFSSCKTREGKEEVHVQRPVSLKEDIVFGY